MANLDLRRLRRRKWRIARAAEEEAHTDGELPLVPFLDILVNVLMFLIVSSGFAAAAEIRVDQPAAACCVDGDAVVFRLPLAVRVSARGYEVALARAGAAAKLPDLPSLAAAARRVKASFPRERRVTLSADAGVPYQRVIEAMDALRGRDGELFPEVTLAAPVE